MRLCCFSGQESLAKAFAGRTFFASRFALVTWIFAISSIQAGATDIGSRVSGEIAVELQNDWNYKSEDRANLNNDLYATIEPSATFQITPQWSVFAHAVSEPIGSPEKFENRAFEDIGLYMEELFVEYGGERFGAKGGKLNPGFGVAWDKAAGLYGTDIAEDYEISERIGVVGSWNIGNGTDGGSRFGKHTISGSTFFADTSIFSQSALRGRGDTREEDGGLSNTESFKSFVFALDGGNIRDLGNFGYHLSFMRQAAGVDNDSNETSIAVAAFTSVDLGGDVLLEPLAEIVWQDNQGGTANVDRTYVTISGQLLWKGWNLAASFTERETDSPTAASISDTHFQVSAGYAFDFGLTIDVGWKVSEDSSVESRTLGILAAYSLEF